MQTRATMRPCQKKGVLYVASVKVRTSPLTRVSVRYFYAVTGGWYAAFGPSPGLRTVPSVAQCRVMSNEEASDVNFPAIYLQILHCAAGAQQ
jgi:hypothetical protein